MVSQNYNFAVCLLLLKKQVESDHKWLLHTWAEIFAAAGLHVESEPKEVFPDTELRPDHKVYNFGSRTLLTDVSGISSICP